MLVLTAPASAATTGSTPMSVTVTGGFLSITVPSASANMGTDQIVLDVVSAAVVGGVSIYGGVGKPYAAVLGAVFITAISNATNLVGIEYSTTLVIKGVIIVFFVALDSARRRSSSRGLS